MGLRVLAWIVLASLQGTRAVLVWSVVRPPVAWLQVDEDAAMKPRLVCEPITGLAWVATTRGSYWLAWLPVACVVAAFGLGYFVGRWR
jgi:hypothetical protein